MCFIINRIKAQRASYIEMKVANPNMRLRSDVSLGPRTTVDVKKEVTSRLLKPESYFGNRLMAIGSKVSHG